MPHHHTHPPATGQGTRPTESNIIDMRRWRRRRDRSGLAEGSVIGCFPHEGGAIRIRAGAVDSDLLHVDGFPEAQQTSTWGLESGPWSEIGLISHRLMPSFTPGRHRATWVTDRDALARKGTAVYYYVLKGYVLDPADQIIATTAPTWIEADVKAT